MRLLKKEENGGSERQQQPADNGSQEPVSHRWQHVSDQCPECHIKMRDICTGSAGNLNGREWYEQHYRCTRCGFVIRVVQTKELDNEV